MPLTGERRISTSPLIRIPPFRWSREAGGTQPSLSRPTAIPDERSGGAHDAVIPPTPSRLVLPLPPQIVAVRGITSASMA